MAPDAAAGGAGAGVQGRARAAAENGDAGAEDAAGSSTMRDQVCVCVCVCWVFSSIALNRPLGEKQVVEALPLSGTDTKVRRKKTATALSLTRSEVFSFGKEEVRRLSSVAFVFFCPRDTRDVQVHVNLPCPSRPLPLYLAQWCLMYCLF